MLVIEWSVPTMRVCTLLYAVEARLAGETQMVVSRVPTDASVVSVVLRLDLSDV